MQFIYWLLFRFFAYHPIGRFISFSFLFLAGYTYIADRLLNIKNNNILWITIPIGILTAWFISRLFRNKKTKTEDEWDKEIKKVLKEDFPEHFTLKGRVKSFLPQLFHKAKNITPITKLLFVIIVLFIIYIYWFGIRPSLIRQSCSEFHATRAYEICLHEQGL